MKITSMKLNSETDVVVARQRAAQISRLIGFDNLEQVRIATAISEIARNAFLYAGAGAIHFEIFTAKDPQNFRITVSDKGPGIQGAQAILSGEGRLKSGVGGMLAASRIMDGFDVDSSPERGTVIVLTKKLPPNAPSVSTAQIDTIKRLLETPDDQISMEGVRQLNSDLLVALNELRFKQEQLAGFNEVLEQNNRGLNLARAEAERAAQAKDDFLATLSHELRTPLTPILGWVRMLREGSLDAEETARALAVIERSVKAQAELINDLLDISRIVSGKLLINICQVNIKTVLEGVIEDVRCAAEAKGIALEAAYGFVGASIQGDPSRLQQVLWNLLTNALKFTSRGGKVEARLQRINAFVEIQIRDNGIGINPEFLPHIFERFSQADSSSTRDYGGLGIGLSLVHSIIGLHGGTIRAESEGLGKGSIFTISLPVKEPVSEIRSVAAMPVQNQKREGTINLGSLRILVVDDDEDARELLRVALSLKGAAVAVASSVDEALQHIVVEPPDLIVSDLAMPGRDGFELIREVKTRYPLMPVIALTAFARDEDSVRCLKAGFRMHLTKPVDPYELISAIERVVSNSAPIGLPRIK
jgi:signal transduction histidine kinase/ActR/RegA family two-component response regulator